MWNPLANCLFSLLGITCGVCAAKLLNRGKEKTAAAVFSIPIWFLVVYVIVILLEV